MSEPTTPNRTPSGREEFRAPTPDERRLLELLLEADFPGRSELVVQARDCQVRPIDTNGSLALRSSGTPSASVVRRIPIEAETEDKDGVGIHVLLHVVAGELQELEIYREDSKPPLAPIDLERLRVIKF